jgi:hypothetical protein
MRSNAKQREMKTPIQELLEHFTDAWSSPSDLWKPSKVIAKIETMLEKEKEFIEDVFVDGIKEEYQLHINGKKQISSSEYYDKKFNQKNANK